jgi:hypothetical protein
MAIKVGQLVVVLFDPDANPRPHGTFRNLGALDRHGNQVWLADTPTTTTGDCYTRIASGEPLVAHSFQSFVCTIDPATGSIIGRVFTK